MDLFDKEYKEKFTNLHTTPFSPNSLDPRVFYYSPKGGEPVMQPQVKTQIMRNIDEINSADQEYNQTRVWDYVVVGPVLKQDSSLKCPIVVMVQIQTANLNDYLKERILQNIKLINGKLASGTQHPIFYVPTIRKIDIEKYDAVYHPYTEKWLKIPTTVKESKTDLEELTKVKSKKNNKQSLQKGLKKLTTI